MFRAKLIVFVAGALLLAQAQCAEVCATQLCGDTHANLPPCHRDHGHHGQDQAPGSCTHPMIGVPPASLQILPETPLLCMMIDADTRAAGAPAAFGDHPNRRATPSPPGFKILSSTVLRI